MWDSGCGSVGRVVDSNSRGPQFKSSHRQKFMWNVYCQLYWKDANKEKEAGICQFLKNNFVTLICQSCFCKFHQIYWRTPCSQCDQVGLLLKGLGDKSSKNIFLLLRLFWEMSHFKQKRQCRHLLGKYWKTLGNFFPTSGHNFATLPKSFKILAFLGGFFKF